MYHYCYCKSCLIDPMWYLCSNCRVKQINNSLKNGTGTTEFCIFWKWSKVQESILWQQIVHGLSSVRKSTGVKSSIIIVLHNFTQLLVITRSEIETTLLKVNSAQSKQESIMEEIVDILTVDNTCNSSSSSSIYFFLPRPSLT